MAETGTISYDAFTKTLPDAVAALRALSQVAAEGLDKGLTELIKVRASQINGCAFCLQLHLNWARKAGVPQSKLDRLSAWREAPGYDGQERAALAWTEALCHPPHGVQDARQGLAGLFDEEQVMRLTVAVAAINAWNRIAGPLGFVPPAAE